MSRLTAEQIHFIDELAALLGTWNLSVHAARLYGYLQLSEQPVSLEEIARDLEISRSHAHTAARLLEGHGNARGVPSRGTRRILYVRGDDPGTPLRKQIATLGHMSELIARSCTKVADGEARERLYLLSDFHKRLQLAMLSVVDAVPAERATKPDAGE